MQMKNLRLVFAKQKFNLIEINTAVFKVVGKKDKSARDNIERKFVYLKSMNFNK